MTVEQPSMSEDAIAQALALLRELQSRVDTLAEVAAEYPNRFAPAPS